MEIRRNIMEGFWILFSAFLVHLFGGGHGLRDVSLRITPSAVPRGESATLECIYDLEGKPLDSVKWYRGSHEFYRYTPTERPYTRIFPIHGLHVDLSKSDDHKVIITKVDFSVAGKVSCEVTTDSIPIATETVHRDLIVVDFPDGPPRLFTERDRYDNGDNLKANCTSQPSKPAAILNYLLNNKTVSTSEPVYGRTVDGKEWTALSLDIRLLPSHYIGGRLALKCVAILPDLPERPLIAEVQLGGGSVEPIPERVRASDSSSVGRYSSSLVASISIVTVTNLLR